MGGNMEKKKVRVTNFFIGNPYMKFQNISIHGYKFMLYTIKQQMAKIAKGHNSNKISLNWLKIEPDNFLLSPNQFTKYQGSSSNAF